VIVTGWLEKRGSFFPTIRKRFFVLYDGILSYYRTQWDAEGFYLAQEELQQQQQSSTPTTTPTTPTIRKTTLTKPPRALGKFPVTGYEYVTDTENGRIELLFQPGLSSISRRMLLVYCEDYMEREKWMRGISAHAAYIID
jgi:hypothetical protein